ncbi:FYN-binding protein 2 isoform X2 [Channa argus]|uniref:FYN-binding protein 2 isoform X2 n=1 Tax=Channa argus TaxID=215402 RepID=UPI0035216EB5
MGEEAPINFKALRAKFQEEALLAQSKISRPAVAEKPKHIPPPGGHYSSMVSSINNAIENKIPVVPQAFFRDGLRTSGGKRPISFPPQLQQSSPPSQLTNVDSTTRQSLKERHMPLVLPVLSKEPERGKEIPPQTKIKKKGLLLPFKSTKASKAGVENEEDPTYAELTTRPSSAPGQLTSAEKLTTEDRVSLQNDKSTAECPLSSPDIQTPPLTAQTNADSDNRNVSTLEKAKKKFSCRQMLISTKPRILLSPDHNSRDKAFCSPPKNNESVNRILPSPPPVSLPHLACISARPFSKVHNTTHKSPLEKQFGRDKKQHFSVRIGEPHTAFVPPKKPLPDLMLLGPLPAKPPRPPLVDLTHYHIVHEVSPGLNRAPTKKPEPEHPSISNPVLDAPEFPDFENSEIETKGGEAFDIAALELEALSLVCTNFPAQLDFRVTDCKKPPPYSSVCDPAKPSVSSVVQDLNLGSQNITPLDPANFPEPINLSEFPEPFAPDQWSQSKEAIVNPSSKSHIDETDLGVGDYHSASEETELSSHTELNEGIQQHPVLNHRNSYCEKWDNVYEDVENVNKFILGQNSRKRKASLKNPYAENHPVKEAASLNMWSRNSCKERQSPNITDHKEQKKREKQRLEKAKKEQKEREKKENEMRKKFKVTGGEEPMYHAKVMMTSKVRKNDLPVKSGDTVSIIRTTNCPKGKWLARDANHKYGYISVMNVELNIKDMLELGKKAQAAGRGGNLEGDTISIGSRSSSHPVLTSSFTDDSEEWSCEDETLSPSNESHCPQQNPFMPDMSYSHVSAQHTPVDANQEDPHPQTRHEALQKLAIFFQHNKDQVGNVLNCEGAMLTNAEPTNLMCAVEEPPYLEQELDLIELELLPPPPLYADTF